MDHYEELGLTRTASQGEIRQAYRRVARLLHPDRCKDDESRRLADLQMKRLNGILEILTDSAARLSYDEQLLIGPSPPPGRHCRAGFWIWPVSSCFLLTALIFSTRHPKDLGVNVHETSLGSAPSLVPGTTPSAHRDARISHVHKAVPPAVAPADAPMLLPPPFDISSPVASEPPVELQGLAAPQPLPPLTDTAPDSLAGEWLYLPPVGVKHGAQYPAEYIELRLTEEGGMLAGKYRARYRVSDRAISPEVAFRFRGNAKADGGSFVWTGAGGAGGQVTLRRLPNGVLEVSWTADQLGTELGLVSGTAMLVRRRE